MIHDEKLALSHVHLQSKKGIAREIRRICLRTFCGLFALYLGLMLLFTGIRQEQLKVDFTLETINLDSVTVSNIHSLWNTWVQKASETQDENVRGQILRNGQVEVCRALNGPPYLGVKAYGFFSNDGTLLTKSGNVLLIENRPWYVASENNSNVLDEEYEWIRPRYIIDLDQVMDRNELKDLAAFIHGSGFSDSGDFFEVSGWIFGITVIPETLRITTPWEATQSKSEGNVREYHFSPSNVENLEPIRLGVLEDYTVPIDDEIKKLMGAGMISLKTDIRMGRDRLNKIYLALALGSPIINDGTEAVKMTGFLKRAQEKGLRADEQESPTIMLTDRSLDRYASLKFASKPTLDLKTLRADPEQTTRTSRTNLDDPSSLYYTDYRDVKESLFTLELNNVYEFIASDGNSYFLTSSAKFFPWESAAADSIQLYLFSFLIVFLVGTILSWKLAGVYRKQQLLEQGRRDMTNAMAHELKTPLGVIRSYSEGLREKIAEEKREHYLDVIIDETDRMDLMVLDLLDLSKLESGACTLNLEVFSLLELTEQLIERHRKPAEKAELNVVIQSDCDWLMNADRNQISQAIENLLCNALRHTTNQGTIQISIDGTGTSGSFTIENDGEQIPADLLPHLFQAFYKGDESRHRGTNGKESGTGLGLTIVKQILDLHQLPFGVENTEVGVKFWFGGS